MTIIRLILRVLFIQILTPDPDLNESTQDHGSFSLTFLRRDHGFLDFIRDPISSNRTLCIHIVLHMIVAHKGKANKPHIGFDCLFCVWCLRNLKEPVEERAILQTPCVSKDALWCSVATKFTAGMLIFLGGFWAEMLAFRLWLYLDEELVC